MKFVFNTTINKNDKYSIQIKKEKKNRSELRVVLTKGVSASRS